MTRPYHAGQIVAAIDVGTNAVRLAIVRARRGARLELLRRERDAVRPGQGVFATGAIPARVADRLVETLRRYVTACRLERAQVRAVATSALREATNGDALVRRVRAETGLEVEIVSGREEARLVCRGVLAGRPRGSRSLVIDIGGGSTEIATAVGERPTRLHSVPLGAVRLTERFGSDGRVSAARLAAMRRFALAAFDAAVPAGLARGRTTLGSSGTIHALVAAHGRGGRISLPAVGRAVEDIARLTPSARRRRFDPHRADVVVAGAVVLEAALRHLRVEVVEAADGGLRDGIVREVLARVSAERPARRAPSPPPPPAGRARGRARPPSGG